jgi:hypothetical protein
MPLRFLSRKGGGRPIYPMGSWAFLLGSVGLSGSLGS